MTNDAMRYYEQGLCIIPAVKGQKRSAVKWERYQERKPERNEVEKWFASNDYNIGIVCGCVSNGLVVFDFDGDNWLKQNELAHLIGVHPSNVCLAERGLVPLTPRVLEGLAKLGYEKEEIKRKQDEFVTQKRRAKISELTLIARG